MNSNKQNNTNQNSTNKTEEETDYYSLLNATRQTSVDELTQLYKKLRVIFHPDKQQDDSVKELAEKKFTLLTKAYETLSDPSTRKLYDLYGSEGVGPASQLAKKYPTMEEINEKYQNYKLKHEFVQKDAKFAVRGNFQMALGLSKIIEGNKKPRIVLGIVNANILQSVRAQIGSVRTTFTGVIRSARYTQNIFFFFN